MTLFPSSDEEGCPKDEVVRRICSDSVDCMSRGSIESIFELPVVSGGYTAATTPVRLLTDGPSLTKEGSRVCGILSQPTGIKDATI